MISSSLFSILLTAVKLGIQINAYLKRRREMMSPEQRAKYDAAMEKVRKENFDQAGNFNLGSGEGASPETPGIILKDALDPAANKDRPVGE